MAELSKVKKLMFAMRIAARHLTDDEVSEIGNIIIKALDRMEKEA